MKKLTLLRLFFLTFFNLSVIHAASLEALFSPQDRLTKQLIELIEGARKSIHAAVYLLTDKNIAQALIDAKTKRKVDVKIIVDTISTDPKYGKADLLAQNNIDVFIFEPKKKDTREITTSKWTFNNPIMHNKFAIFDTYTVWTGSFNWTVSANITNCENVIIMKNNRAMSLIYEEYFSTLLTTRCTPYSGKQKTKAITSLRDNVIDAVKTSDDDVMLLKKLTHIMNDLMPKVLPEQELHQSLEA